MEVGVDLDNLTEAILFKPRNIASYRQKSDGLAVSGMRYLCCDPASFRAIDFTIIETRHRFSATIIWNQSLSPQNLDLKRQLAFHAIMDWFSRQHTMVRVLDSAQCHDAVADGLNILERRRMECATLNIKHRRCCKRC